MAIVDVRVRRSLTLSESRDDKGAIKTTADLELLVVSDTKDPGFASILANTATWPNLGGIAIPRIGTEAVVNEKTLVVTQRDLAFDGDSDRVVVVKIKYSAKDDPSDNNNDKPSNTDPETWQRITIQTQQMTEPMRGFVSLQDAINNAGQDFARNSAGDPVDGLEEDVAMVKMTYTNSRVVNPNFDKLHSFVNTCNSDPFLGAPVYRVRCMGWSGEYDQKNNCWSISVEFLYKPGAGWEVQFYDVGFNEIIDGQRRAILDKAGNPVSKPVPLDGAGKAAAIGTSTSSENYQPVELTLRYMWPYQAVNMNNVFADCGI